MHYWKASKEKRKHKPNKMSDLLKALRDKRLVVHKRLNAIQGQIYDLEDAYLESTAPRGNVVRGWEGYLDYKKAPNGQAKLNYKRPKASDRIFSFSSTTAVRLVF